ncbi:unannotated protein [freshwater metagenome]|uniref:Unannotated protein n=1 Tax=freshwater metagenome TaxID=449393 RepID=A0A6J7P5U5_9ZZZZ
MGAGVEIDEGKDDNGRMAQDITACQTPIDRCLVHVVGDSKVIRPSLAHGIEKLASYRLVAKDHEPPRPRMVRRGRRGCGSDCIVKAGLAHMGVSERADSATQLRGCSTALDQRLAGPEPEQVLAPGSYERASARTIVGFHRV